MEELAVNLTEKEVLTICKNFPLSPTRNRIVVTVNTEENDELDLRGAGLAETQYVLAAGPHVWDQIKPGSKVLLDLDKMSVQVSEGFHEIKLDPIKVGNRVYAFVYDSNIKSIDNR